MASSSPSSEFEDRKHVPMIDISCLFASPVQEEARNAVVQEIGKACESFGMFQVRADGVISDAITDSLFSKMKEYFSLDFEAKERIASNFSSRCQYTAVAKSWIAEDGMADLSERFSFGWQSLSDPSYPEFKPSLVPDNKWKITPAWGPEEWLAEVEGFREALNLHWTNVRSVGQKILDCIASYLGLPDDFFSQFSDKRVNAPIADDLQLLKYPASAASKGQVVAGRHTDYGYIAVLKSDSPGLYCEGRDGQVYGCPPITDHFVVTIGIMGEMFTHKRFLASPHWVVAPGTDRLTAAYFTDPPLEAEIPNQNGKTFKEFVAEFSKENYVQNA